MLIQLDKVLISDEVDIKCVNILQNNGVEVVKSTKLSKAELIAEIPKYDGLIVRSATKVTAEVINAGTRLKIIGRAGTGVDNIDTEAATRKGVIVMNTPGGNTLSAAEHTCTLIIALTRYLGSASLSMKEGKWERKQFMGSELYGKTLGIIGLGRIGKEVALRMQSFGMTTIGFDPILGASESAKFNTEWMTLEELWPRADYITVHTPLIPQTKNLLCDATFAKCKKGVKVVNCARGGIIDESALLRALESGQCGAAGLDVFAEEPPTDFTLIKHPNVVATPHLGASTIEAQTRVAEEIAQQFVELREGKSLVGAINAQSLTFALSPDNIPLVQLSERLGVVGCLMSNSLSITTIEVNMYGDSLKKSGSFLLASMLVGFLKTSAQDNGDSVPLNMVNAPLYAKLAGLSTSVEHKGPSDVPYLVVTLQGASRDILELCGCVEGAEVKLLSIQKCVFNASARLKDNIIIFRVYKELNISEIVGATVKDGLPIRAISVSEIVNGEGYGIINLAAPVTGPLKNLESVVHVAYGASF